MARKKDRIRERETERRRESKGGAMARKRGKIRAREPQKRKRRTVDGFDEQKERWKLEQEGNGGKTVAMGTETSRGLDTFRALCSFGPDTQLRFEVSSCWRRKKRGNITFQKFPAATFKGNT